MEKFAYTQVKSVGSKYLALKLNNIIKQAAIRLFCLVITKERIFLESNSFTNDCF